MQSMHEVCFASHRHLGTSLELAGPRFNARVTCVELADGQAWRILVWHRLEDAHKGSTAVGPTRAVPFEVRVVNQTLHLSASTGQAPLTIHLAPFAFQFEGLEATELEAHRFGELGRSGARSFAHWTAFHEVNDGLPLGAGLTLELRESEHRHYYGLGERTGWLDKKGRTWTNWATDTPRHDPDLDPMYQAHPFLMGFEEGRAWGLYLDESWRTVFELASVDPQQSLVHTDGPTFDLYLLAGPSPREVLQNYTALVGRASLPPLWALGYHTCRYSYATQELALEVARQHRLHELPLDGLWLDIDYMEGFKVFTFSPQRFPDPARLTQQLAEMGVHTVAIVDPGVKKEVGYPVYEQGKEKGYFIKTHRDEELVGEVWPNPAVWPDFVRPEVQQWWGELHRFYLERGIAGIWNDMNEPAAFSVVGHTTDPHNRTLPHTARQGNTFHAEAHNLYGLGMSQATYQGLQRLQPDQRPFVLTRSGFTGIQKYAFVWTGDNHAYWEHLEASIPQMLNLGLSGVPFVGADLGGFGADVSGELLSRWTWLGVFYPFMRNHSAKGTRRAEPWTFGEPWLSHIREALRLRYRLLPYLYTLAQQATQDGLPLMRPLLLDFPHDPQTYGLADQFLAGPSLLVAPALRPQQQFRAVYLPQGQWQDFWTGQRWSGGQAVVVPTPQHQIPLFVRQGAAVATTLPANHTSSAHWEVLRWEVHPAPQIHGVVYEDTGNGPANGHFVRLEGGLEGQRLWLKVSDPLCETRPHHQVILRGVTAPSQISVPYSYHPESQTLLLELRDHLSVVW